ncbi:hypothetical protein CRM22_004619 [Opisthorchis felineus]|uniref:AB hydrolase-1 domain-containing protein n=4 Tax=Opisthorchis felineus TaxID=147828 RepID=A0A4V3SFB2_OPIFE|nr:hypothetical protein CRM22_004619 [Opisthorchis felineus]TGZ67775.1 hypothetical protein CRM22_004619 [Opisthorchis felineus]
MAGLGMANEVHHRVHTEAAGELNVYVQGTVAPLKPVFLTVHDLGCNHYQYEDFVANPKMIPFMQRAVWLHIDLPGQGDGEEELPATYVFPPISKLPEAMKEVLDHFKIKQLVLFGEGAGANILARFAIMYDNLVLGAILIHCTAASASFAEAIKDKLINWKLNLSGMNAATESFLILHRFGPIMDTDSEVELRNAVENFRQNLRHSINPKNLNRFISSYMQRKTLTDNLAGLKCPVLLITGSLSSQRRACRQLFEDLQKAQKHAEGRLTTREFFVIDGVANVIAERPDKVITSMQFFLQGIGLLSNLQMQKTPLQLNRRMSMEDYDRPLGKLHFVNRLSHRLSEETDS